jgi:hypothetical protein
VAELGTLNIPIRTTGRAEALADLEALDRAGQKTGLSFERAAAAMGGISAAGVQVTNASARMIAGMSQAGATAASASKQMIIGMSAAGVAAQEAATAANAGTSGMLIFGKSIGGVLEHGQGGARALHGMANAIVLMGASALGAEGPILRLGESIALFSGGIGWVLGFGAALAAVGFIYDQVTESSRKTREEHEKLLEEFGKPIREQVVADAVDLARKNVADAEKALADARAHQGPITDPRHPLTDFGEIDKATKDLEKAQNKLNDAEAQGNKLHQDNLDLLDQQRVKAIQLGTAFAYDIDTEKQKLAELKHDAAASPDLPERNRLQGQANEIEAALDAGRTRSIELAKTQLGLGINQAAAVTTLRDKEAELRVEIAAENGATDRRIRLTNELRESEAALDAVRTRGIESLRIRAALGLAGANVEQQFRQRINELSVAISKEADGTDRSNKLLRERLQVQADLDAIEQRRIGMIETRSSLKYDKPSETVAQLLVEESKLVDESKKLNKESDDYRTKLQQILEIQRQIKALAPAASETFGRPLSFGQKLGPNPFAPTGKLPDLKGVFGQSDQTAAFFGGGFNFGMDKSRLDAAAKSLAEKVAEVIGRAAHAPTITAAMENLQTSLKLQIKDAMVGGIADGFEAAFATGKIDDGFKTLAASMLQGLGSAAIAFGSGALAIAIQMKIAKDGMESLQPEISIPAALALIALGGALKGVASSMFKGGSSGGAGGGTGQETFIHRVFVSSDGKAHETTRSPSSPSQSAAAFSPQVSVPMNRDASTLKQPTQTTYNFTLIGANDPTVQRSIADIVNAADNRGLVTIGGRA